MGFLSKLFSSDPWAKMPQSVQIVMRRRLSTDEFDQLTTLLRKHGELRKPLLGFGDPQILDENILDLVAMQFGISATFGAFTVLERELLVNLSLRLDPENILGWQRKAYIHVRQGRFEEAQNAARQALKILKTDKLETSEFDDPKLNQAMHEVKSVMELPEDFDQDAADDQLEAALEGIVQGRYNLLYFKSRVDSAIYDVMKQVVAGALQQSGVRLNSETDLEQKGLDPDFQRVLAATAVRNGYYLIAKDSGAGYLAHQAANAFDGFNLLAHMGLAAFMDYIVQNTDESDPEDNIRVASQQARFHALMALKLLQIPQMRHEIVQVEEKEAGLMKILNAHPQS